jgi:uncharacterized Zn finger protein
MDEQEKEELIEKIDDLLDGSREGRAVKELVERLPTDDQMESEQAELIG